MTGYITHRPTEERLYQILSENKYNGTLFHYTGKETAKLICKNDTFWLTRIDYLDDLSEGSEILTYFKEVAEEMYLNGLLDTSFYQIILDYKEEDLNSSEAYSFYTACFTTEEDSYLMWKAYADNAQGCCIKFHTSQVESRIAFVNVIYNSEEKRKLVRIILAEINKLIGWEKETYLNLLYHMITTLRYIFKTKPFETEKEVRIIYQGHITLEEKQEIRPHVELKFGMTPGYNLILGPKNDYSDEDYYKSIGTNLTNVAKSSIKLRDEQGISNSVNMGMLN